MLLSLRILNIQASVANLNNQILKEFILETILIFKIHAHKRTNFSKWLFSKNLTSSIYIGTAMRTLLKLKSKSIPIT